MNMEPLREFVSLETRKKELDAELKAAKQRLDELEEVKERIEQTEIGNPLLKQILHRSYQTKLNNLRGRA